MAPTSHLGVRTVLASIQSAVSTDGVPASSLQFDGHVIASTLLPRISDRSGGPISWPSIVRGPSFWEGALIVALFLLISGLVGIRLAEFVSDRDLELERPTLPPEAETSVETPATDERDRSPTADHRPYEQYLSPDTPPELLSDDGKVVRLLVENDGRIRQHRIADETGWSKSKVSRICSQMHADGTIEKRSVGRENLITLSERQADETTESDDIENPAA
ncbi:helix-turn-helix domain-containing protein [Natronorubrum sp. JWXQ-INN-674]|uniref:Helix-turn-helix domain-containing protein n=1 Tax=Natronorubrum halalkaliphilum TaxID=2691917 RepID=A0A6B0VRZ9_9EURY|nr:helix-turn-helix domain-containing protein [Natronorubrum halalkaliphilum]MXV64125.1 helix-turn-helix domain-containing protein [Natronorubrum halalkaliphilum]